MEIRAKKAHPRSLPSMPPKDFIPTHSAEETASINAMIDERVSFLKEERAEKRYFPEINGSIYSKSQIFFVTGTCLQKVIGFLRKKLLWLIKGLVEAGMFMGMTRMAKLIFTQRKYFFSSKW